MVCALFLSSHKTVLEGLYLGPKTSFYDKLSNMIERMNNSKIQFIVYCHNPISLHMT